MPKPKGRRQSVNPSTAAPRHPLGNTPTQPSQPPRPRLAPPLVPSAPPVAGPSSYPTTTVPLAINTSDTSSTSLKELREHELPAVSFLKNDMKQKLVRQRREEMNKKYEANTEKNFLEKERRAQLQFEKWLESKQQKIKEQKRRDEQRRMSVESKRKLKLEQETEHYKAVVNRTMERTNRLEAKRLSLDSTTVGPTDHRRSSVVSSKENKPHSCVDKEGTDNSQATRKYVLRYVHVPLLNIRDKELKTSMIVQKSKIQDPRSRAVLPEETVEAPETTIKVSPDTRADISSEVNVNVPTVSTEVHPLATISTFLMKPEIRIHPISSLMKKHPNIPSYLLPSTVTRWPSASLGNTLRRLQSHYPLPVLPHTPKFAHAPSPYSLASFRPNIVPPAALRKKRDTVFRATNKSEALNQQVMSSENSHNKKSSRTPNMDAATTSAKKYQGEKRRGHQEVGMPRKSTTMGERSTERMALAKWEEPRKSKAKTNRGHSSEKSGRKVSQVPAVTSSSGSSDDNVADGPQIDRLTLAEKLEMYYKNMVKPQKLLFLHSEANDLQERKKVYFHKYVTTFGEKGTEIESLAQPSTSRQNTDPSSSFSGPTFEKDEKEANALEEEEKEERDQ